MTSSTFAPVQLLPLGAIIQAFVIDGINIVQGFPTEALYKSHNDPYFGETIGRVANRIKDGKIDSLNGKTYTLAQNCATNSLHGGEIGWGKKTWDGPSPVGLKEIPGLKGAKLEGGESVVFKLRSEDGDQGFPGTVDVSVTYTSGTQKTDDGRETIVLAFEYEAELVGGADETVINMTNHSYFNLSGDATIVGTQVQLESNLYLPLDDTGVPTSGPTPNSEIRPKTPFTLGAESPSYDDCFVTSSNPSCPLDTRNEPLNLLVSASHPKTKIHLEVLGTEPAFQFYTGQFVDVDAVADVKERRGRSAFCVEPSRYVNAINVDDWKHQVLLKRGDKYGARIVYRGWSENS